MESNKKPGTEAEGRLQTVISELDVTIGDLLDKADFALMELMEVVAVHVDNTPDDKAKKINRVNGLADIAYDYVVRAQSAHKHYTAGTERTEAGTENPCRRCTGDYKTDTAD